MNITAITALVVAVTGLITAAGTLISHVQLRRQVDSQGTAVKATDQAGNTRADG